MKKTLIGVVFAFYVCTYSGQKVAGPFTLLTDCSEMARIMAAKYYNISTVCRAF